MRKPDKRLRRTESVVSAYNSTGHLTDPLGMYTGNPNVIEPLLNNLYGDEYDDTIYIRLGEIDCDPVQDADDL